MYNITTTEWTWLSGNNTENVNGFYGTKGVASSDAYPGGRRHTAMIFHSTSNSLYVFGGEGMAATGGNSK